MGDPVRIRLTPVVSVQVDGRRLEGRELGSRKGRTLLAMLAAQRGASVSLDLIVESLWPPEPGRRRPADAAAGVATLVSRLRRTVGDGVVTGHGRAYRLAEDGGWLLEVDEAADLLHEAESRLRAGDSALAAAAARRARELLGSEDALVDEADTDWVARVRRETEDLRRRARQVLAESLLHTEPDEAASVASETVRDDPYDEAAVRVLMRALVSGGRASAALAAYRDLADRLADDLGTDPDPLTTALHLAVLRSDVPAETETPTGGGVQRRPETSRRPILGRDAELAVVEQRWRDAGEGTGSLVLLRGDAGMGKTRLMDAAEALADETGGLVLRARCHPAERSLFLQPLVDALRPVLLGSSTSELTALVSQHSAAWVTLMPELCVVVDAPPQPVSTPELERRRAYDAVLAVLQRLARNRPVLVAIDDLHDAGMATVELLGYLAGRLDRLGVLLLGAERPGEHSATDRIGGRATRLTLPPLPGSAVEAMATAAGLPTHAPEVLRRTGGHPLSVVECLRALAAGDAGVPASLAFAILGRVARLERGAREVVESASVLGRRLHARQLVGLTGSSELDVVRRLEMLVDAGLMVRDGAVYDFVNDLVQECVLASLAPALAVAYHRRAADQLAGRPESMAEHALAAGDPARASRGWLLAGQAAMGRSATEDAVTLFDRAVSASSECPEEPDLRARALLARSRAHEARTSYAAALADIDAALVLARSAHDPRLELAALRARGGDPAVALQLPMTAIYTDLDRARGLAGGLGDRRAELDMSTRLVVLDVQRLRLTAALDRAEAALVRARAGGSPDAVEIALDGVKTAAAYLGDADRLAVVVDELEALLRRRGSRWLLQWTVFESSFVPAADGDWDAARDRVAEAVAINRSSGFDAYAGFFLAHLGWFERLAGNLDASLERGHEAVARTSSSDHPWWFVTAAGLLASGLVAAERPEEARRVARRGLAATGPHTAEAGRLRCLSPLAVVDDDPSVLRAAAGLVADIDCPTGGAWVTGADCYLLVARGHLQREDVAQAARTLAPLRAAVTDRWASVRSQISSVTS